MKRAGVGLRPPRGREPPALPRRIGGADGIDAVLEANNLQALVAPTGSPAWTTDLVNGDHFLGASSSPSAIAGYPIINVPSGNSFGLPVGSSFIATWSEPTLIKLASGFEAATKARQKPQFRRALPLDGPFQALLRQGGSGRRARPRSRRRSRVVSEVTWTSERGDRGFLR